VNRRCRCVQVAIAGLLCWVVPARSQERPAQEVHRAAFVPLGDEAFDIVTDFYRYDRGLELNARTVDSWESEIARLEKIVFTTSTGERVPGELAIPLQGKPPFPVVLLLHGLGNSRQRWEEEDRASLQRGLLAAGAATFAIDLELHGERAARNDYQSPVYLTFGDSLFIRSRDMLIQSTIDARRALDVLRARADIDGRRMGVVGYSMGGMIAVVLSALESDLAGAVACAVPMVDQPAPIDPFQFAPHARVSLLLLIGRSDWLSSPPDAEMLRGLVPVPGSRLVFYESGHVLPTAFTTDAHDWIVPRLKARSAE
jgi:dienelactone hydrolase